MIHYYVNHNGDNCSIGQNNLGKVIVEIESNGIKAALTISPDVAIFLARKLTDYAEVAIKNEMLEKVRKELGVEVLEIVRTYKPDVIKFE